MARAYHALRWVGGKSAYSQTGTGRWIAGLLPPPGSTYTYIEPFAGMAGVLLQREPTRREILNDMDKDLFNWWRVVRDRPGELGELLDWTPGWSAAEFGEAVSNLGCDDSLYQAYYFTLAVSWVRGAMIGRVRQAQRSPKQDDGLRRSRGSNNPGIDPLRCARSIMDLTERIKHVELKNETAESICRYYADDPKVTWYLDPPYPSAAPKSTLYTHNELDMEEWVPILGKIKGLVAISGYGDEWQELERSSGWERHEHRTFSAAGKPGKQGRVEVLWTNYDPSIYEKQPDLFGGAL